MAEFEVSVVFESARFEDHTSTIEYALPPSFEFGSILVTADDRSSQYVARMRVTTESPQDAKRATVEKVQRLLDLLAVSNDAYRIRLGPDHVKATRLPDAPTLAVAGTFVEEDTIDPATGARHIHVSNVSKVGSESYVELRKIKGSIDFEVQAFEQRSDWPDWLDLALELNYLATGSLDVSPSFVIHYAALELIVEKTLGPPDLLLSEQLSRQQRKDLRNRIRLLLDEYGLSDHDSSRLSQRLDTTHAISRITYLQAGLSHYDIEAAPEDVLRVVRERGKVAHGRVASESDGVQLAASLTRSWVQGILRAVIDDACGTAGS